MISELSVSVTVPAPTPPAVMFAPPYSAVSSWGSIAEPSAR
jgi:hypothetical protein